MPAMLKKSYKAKKYRLRRRFTGVFGDLFRALCLLFSITVLSFSFVYVYSCFLSSPYFEIRETSVRGLKELTEKDVLALAQIKPAQNLFAVNTSAIKRKVSENPWVRNIYVGRELPDRLVLELQERDPVALLRKGNSFYLVDTEGAVFKELGKNDEVDLPLLTGFDQNDKTKFNQLSSAVILLKTLSNSRQNSYLGSISEVNIDEVYGLSVITDKGFYLRMGMEGFENKLKNLKIVMGDLEKRGMKNNYFYIDLCDESKITVQRKNTMVRTQQDEKGKRYRI
jgi:cell division protein FtsQ